MALLCSSFYFSKLILMNNVREDCIWDERRYNSSSIIYHFDRHTLFYVKWWRRQANRSYQFSFQIENETFFKEKNCFISNVFAVLIE